MLDDDPYVLDFIPDEQIEKLTGFDRIYAIAWNRALEKIEKRLEQGQLN